MIGLYGCSPSSEPVDHRRPLVQQADQAAQQAGLALPALAEHDHVVAGDQGTLQLRQHGVLEAEDARPDVASLGQRGQQVLPNLGLDATLAVTGGLQRAERTGEVVR